MSHEAAAPRGTERWRPAGDVAVALVAALLVATGSFGASDVFGPSWLGPDSKFPPAVIGVPLGLGVAWSALWRRRWPALFLGLALAANIVVAAQIVVILALFSYAARTASWFRALAACLVSIGPVGVPILVYAGPDGAVPLTLAVCVVPTAVGLYVGTRRELIARIRERAERAESEQQQRIAQARSEERTQIARDMHDIVTHRVALMVLHATALETTGDEQAAEIGRQIGTTGREALGELRSLVGVLRNDGDAPTRPATGLGDLDDLVEESRQLGVPVAMEVVNRTDRRPSVLVEHAIYRVIQEALANVHKHAPGARTWVRVDQGPDVISLTVSNTRGTRTPVLGGGGHGLLGITERIRLIGGEVTAGPTREGGFEIVATIPLARVNDS